VLQGSREEASKLGRGSTRVGEGRQAVIKFARFCYFLSFIFGGMVFIHRPTKCFLNNVCVWVGGGEGGDGLGVMDGDSGGGVRRWSVSVVGSGDDRGGQRMFSTGSMQSNLTGLI
jgi:hypothetical protein